jgi:predicted nucleic acid-binding Zn ribbon protein
MTRDFGVQTLLDLERNCPRCPVCGDPMGPRALTCSSRCRGIRWRQQRTTAQATRDEEVRTLLELALAKLATR